MEYRLNYLVILLVYCKTIHSQISTFSNPVLDFTIGDVTVHRIGGNYYLAYADNAANELQILKSSFLTDFRNAEKAVAYRRPSGYTQFYPQAFMEYQNDLYLYFHMQNETTPWRMFVTKANDPTNPMATWNVPVRVLEPIWNTIAHQGAPLQMNGQLYFVWASPSDTTSIYGFYIAKLQNPNRIEEPVVLLREPNEDWVCAPSGPSFLYNREKVYLVFTSCTQNSTTGTSLRSMSIELGTDPLISSNWKDRVGSVFQGNEEENVYQIRYSEFTTSPNGIETWMMYIASTNMSDLGGSSCIRIENIDWDRTDGAPIFPSAKANGYQQQLPSGEAPKYVNPVYGEFDVEAPTVYRAGGTYYSASSHGRDLVILESDKLYDFTNAEKAVVFTAAEGLIVDDARIFEINGDVYLYFHTYSSTQRHFLYVSIAENKINLLQNWGTPIRLLEDMLDGLHFHPSILRQDDRLYIIWSHNNNNHSSVEIYIAPMVSPTEVAQPAVLLKKPVQTWECYTTCMANYPALLYHKNRAFLVFGASHWIGDSASLSYMSIESGKDPLDVTNWYTASGPVFASNAAEYVYGPGRAWFTTSPDGLQDWMIYYGSSNASDVNGSRSVRIQIISWDEETGHPNFPKPHGFNYPLAIPSALEYFTNPVIDNTTVSPSVIRIGNFYYMLLSPDGGSELKLLKSGKLEDFRSAEKKIVYSSLEDHLISGSSKLHQIHGQLYIYLSMETQNSTSNIFVLQAQDPSNPMGLWNYNPTPILPSWDLPAFQSTLLEHNENFYLVWITPNPASGFNSIYIVKMKNATHVLEPINLIRHPTELWECDGGCSNQAPYFIYNEGTAYMVHSVGAMCKAGNALTYMSIEKDKDPLNSVNWVKAPGKVFSENLDESVFCPAHATFTVSPDQKETWMVYHATNSPHVDAVKSAHIEKITWNKDTGEPIFPEPHGLHHQQIAPGRKVD